MSTDNRFADASTSDLIDRARSISAQYGGAMNEVLQAAADRLEALQDGIARYVGVFNSLTPEDISASAGVSGTGGGAAKIIQIATIPAVSPYVSARIVALDADGGLWQSHYDDISAYESLAAWDALPALPAAPSRSQTGT